MTDQEFTTDLTVVERCDAADSVVVLTLSDADGRDLPTWSPGAHIDLLLDDGLVRQYSLCGDPRDSGHWRIGVLLDPNSRGGSQFVHDRLVTGSTVRVRGPRNNFPLTDADTYLFIAGGIGITPIMAMAEEAHRSGKDWSLLYLGRSASTMAFADNLVERHGDRVRLWRDDENGIFDIAGELADPRENTLVYCCGPEPLLAAVEQHCGAWPAGSLHVERFTAKQFDEPDDGGLESFQVVCRKSAITVDVSADTSILEALEDADVEIFSSCLEGVCGTCEASVLEGDPEHRDSVLTNDQRAAGDVILTCVSRSRSPKLVLDL
ncbi:MAG: PDR/VanB family oxidoreductase [Mycobacterium kyogaense]|uniref:PDR/VanB family oxidoreductase n=1 Tax=Mycobacterium kyogaense TaxID=2212479 RepID=UPI002FF99DC2